MPVVKKPYVYKKKANTNAKRKNTTRVVKNTYVVAQKSNTPFADQGQLIGSSVGSFLGRTAGSMLGRIFGSGDYKIMHRPKYNTLLQDSVPEFGKPGGANSIRVKHREYIGDISGSVAYVTQALLYINPGLSSTFPWLSQIASSFQQYKIHGLCLCIKSISGDAVSSTNSALGTIITSFNFNSSEAAFVNKQQQLETDFACDEKPSVSFIAPMECKKNQTSIQELYVRQQGIQSNQNQQLYDMALLQVATQGMQAVYDCAELYLTYDIELIKPIANVNSLYYHYHMPATGVSTSAYFGTYNVSNVDNTTTMSGFTLSTTTITFPSYMPLGHYMMSISWLGSSTTVVSPTLTPTGCNFVSQFNTGANGYISGNGSSCIDLITNAVVNVTSTGATIVLSGGTLPSSVTAGDLIILSMPVNSA